MCNAYRFIFMQIKLIFIYERFCTKTRFKTEAQGNSEMAYLFHFLSLFFSYFWQLLNAMRVPTSQNLLEEPCVKATKLKRLPAIRYCLIDAWQWNTPCILDNWARGQSSKGTVPTALRVSRTVRSIVSARIVTTHSVSLRTGSRRGRWKIRRAKRAKERESEGFRERSNRGGALARSLFAGYYLVEHAWWCFIRRGRRNNKVYYRLSHDVVTWDVDRDVSTA